MAISIKSLSAVLIAALISMGSWADALRLSEPVAQDERTETFGAPLPAERPSLSLRELIDGAEQYLGKEVLVASRVGKVCQKKGCFFIATQDGLAIRVSFRDYGFFVPTDTGGKVVTLAGQLVRRTLSAEQAAHYNSDLRDGSASVAPGAVYEIVADGVRVPKDASPQSDA